MDRQSGAWSHSGPQPQSSLPCGTYWLVPVGTCAALTSAHSPDKALALCCSKEEQLGLVKTLSWTEAELWGCPGVEL